MTNDRHRFRVWFESEDEGESKYLDIDLFLHNGCVYDNDGFWIGDYPGHKNHVIEFCTGLSAAKSYRGNKPEDLLVFEGDVLKTSTRKENGVVAWNCNLCWYQLLLPKFREWGTFPSQAEVKDSKVEIIGTIHDKEVSE